MKQPLVSVIIPAYNAQKYIGEALESVFWQGYESIEVIVVNDGSTDGTLEALRPFARRAKIISQQNQGQAAARNTGIKMAQGELMGFLDADDIWPKNHLALMLPYLAPESPYQFVRGISRCIRDFGNGFEEVEQDIFIEALVGTCLYKTSLFDRVGLFDETMRQGEDFDWNIRLAESGCQGKKISDVALLYRRHPGSLTSEKKAIASGQIMAMRKKLARARRQAGQPT